jgi:hypothetical protein
MLALLLGGDKGSRSRKEGDRIVAKTLTDPPAAVMSGQGHEAVDHAAKVQNPEQAKLVDAAPELR